MIKNFAKKYGKALVSFLFAVAIAAWQSYSGDREIDLQESVVIAMAFGNSALTLIVPVLPQYPWTKSLASAIVAAASVAATLLLDGVQGNDISIIIASVAQAFGVRLAPAISDNGSEAQYGIRD